MSICRKCDKEFTPIKGLLNYCSYNCKNLHKSNRGRTEEEILQIVEDNKELGRWGFKKKYGHIIVRAKQLGIIDKVNEIIKSKIWAHTYEECFNASLKCKTIKEFRLNHQREYLTCHKKGWNDIIDSLVHSDMNSSKRCVYVYEFSDNSIYVGLTWNFEERHYNHTLYDGKDNRSAVKKYIDKTNLQPTYRIVLDYTDKTIASKFENKLIKEYRDKGYNVLNKIKGGGLGFSKKFNKDEIISEALKYDSRTRFMMGSGGHYRRAIKEGWLDEVCSHMEPQRYWTEERVKELIKEHNITNRTGSKGLKGINNNAYRTARIFGFLEKLLPVSRIDKSNEIKEGIKIGKLTVVRRYMSEKSKHGNRSSLVECICDCGNKHITIVSSLVNGKCKSCGCLRKESNHWNRSST